TKISFGLWLLLLLGGCVGTRYLAPEQKLLYKQSIEAPKGFDKEGLNDIYAQKANRRLLFFRVNTLTWMYYWGLKAFAKETSWPVRSKNDFIRKRDKKEKKFNEKIATAKRDRRKANLAF